METKFATLISEVRNSHTPAGCVGTVLTRIHEMYVEADNPIKVQNLTDDLFRYQTEIINAVPRSFTEPVAA